MHNLPSEEGDEDDLAAIAATRRAQRGCLLKLGLAVLVCGLLIGRCIAANRDLPEPGSAADRYCDVSPNSFAGPTVEANGKTYDKRCIDAFDKRATPEERREAERTMTEDSVARENLVEDCRRATGSSDCSTTTDPPPLNLGDR